MSPPRAEGNRRPRSTLPWDHRIVDGELGSIVLREVGAMLEDPTRMLAWS